MKRKKPKKKRIAPEPPKQEIVKPIAPDAPEIKVVTRKIRQITLPQEIIELAEMTHVSIPSKLGANIAKLIFSFLFLLFLFIPIGSYIDSFNSSHNPDFASRLIAFFLFLILAGIGYVVLKYAYKKTNTAPPTVYVTPTELYVEDAQASEKKDIYITWANVISNPERYVDVRFTTASGSESVIKNWYFFEKDGERVVGSKLGINDLRAMGIKNKWAINRAILANFAVHAKEPLAINSDVLVSLEINPITWQRDNQPRYTEGLFMGIATLALCVALFIFIYNIDRDAGVGYLISGLVLALIVIFIPIALFGYQLSAKLFPEFYGDNIVFVHPKAPSTEPSFEQVINDFIAN